MEEKRKTILRGLEVREGRGGEGEMREGGGKGGEGRNEGGKEWGDEEGGWEG